MSPSPAENRTTRIDELVEYGKSRGDNWINMYDRLFTKATLLWPTVARPTRQSYAKAAHMILMAERNQ